MHDGVSRLFYFWNDSRKCLNSAVVYAVRSDGKFINVAALAPKNSANIELHFWIIHETLPILNGGTTYDSLFSPFLFRSRSLCAWIRRVGWGAENQWEEKMFFRSCYIRKNSLPKEKDKSSRKAFLIRSLSSLSLSLTHPFLWSPSWVCFCFFLFDGVAPHTQHGSMARRKIVENKRISVFGRPKSAT